MLSISMLALLLSASLTMDVASMLKVLLCSLRAASKAKDSWSSFFYFEQLKIELYYYLDVQQFN